MKKLSLQDLSVQSFITGEDLNAFKLKGGIHICAPVRMILVRPMVRFVTALIIAW
ncbi:pinensin family lanthipeptide [Roseivirga sp. BDSF3-8]|uniref:pinensin family lanthipeptide n=1 Tax=Roseivirga sp. BDSF3-8 TaxID=3241598 RepID=UPI003532103D